MTEAKSDKLATTEKPTQQSDTKKTALSSGFLFYLVFMIFLTIGSCVAVYFYTPLVLMSLAPHKPLAIKPHKTSQEESVLPSFQKPVVEKTQEEINLFDQNVITEEKNFLAKDEDTLFSLETPKETEPAFQAQEAQQPTSVLINPSKSSNSYSVLKAIELRDALKSGSDCRPLLEELIALPNKTPEMDQALMKLLQSCLDRPITGQMKQAFYAAKKRAILRIFQAENPTYIAYLKALPYFIIHIRKKNPTTNAPLDILDRIQNAIDEERPQLVLKLIPELPENVQATLHDVTQLAEAEFNLNKTLNQLMKALFDGEEKQ